MSGDLPDDWFRPRVEPRPQTGEDQPQDTPRGDSLSEDTQPGGLRPADHPRETDPTTGAGSGSDAARPAEPPRPTEAAPGADERYTDQFKPVDRPAVKLPVAEHRRPHSSQTAALTRTDPNGQPVAAADAENLIPGQHSVGVAPGAPPVVDVIDERRPRSRTGTVMLTTASLAGVLLVGAGIGQVLANRSRQVPEMLTTPSPTAPAAASTALVPWTGAVEQVEPDSVSASCTAPSQVGYDGSTVPSDASRVLDADLSTGWRCDGSGVSQTLTFTFPTDTEVVGVRMTNGYTKTVDGKLLYPEYRRLGTVTWSFPKLDNAYFLQNLIDGSTDLQEIRIPPTEAAGGMQMQITASSQPGTSENTRDAVLVTEVEFLTRKK